MSKLISISINVDLLDKSKLYKGKKGTYLNVSGFLKEEADQYGNNGFVTQDGVKTLEQSAPILGNFKMKNLDSFKAPNTFQAPSYPSASVVEDDALPF